MNKYKGKTHRSCHFCNISIERNPQAYYVPDVSVFFDKKNPSFYSFTTSGISYSLGRDNRWEDIEDNFGGIEVLYYDHRKCAYYKKVDNEYMAYNIRRRMLQKDVDLEVLKGKVIEKKPLISRRRDHRVYVNTNIVDHEDDVSDEDSVDGDEGNGAHSTPLISYADCYRFENNNRSHELDCDKGCFIIMHSIGGKCNNFCIDTTEDSQRYLRCSKDSEKGLRTADNRRKRVMVRTALARGHLESKEDLAFSNGYKVYKRYWSL